MPLPEYFAYQRNQEDGCVSIVALNFTLDQKQLDPTSDLHIFADVLTLPDSRISLPGKNILIRARKIIANNSILDTSAAAILPASVPAIDPPMAPSGVNPGESGQTGKNGGSTPETLGQKGKQAGSITIFTGEITGNINLSAIGGKGQKGQDGQHGGNGQPGANGADAQIIYLEHPSDVHIIPAVKGYPGGKGGKGGAAGKSGDGGDGAEVTFMTMTALNPQQLMVNNNGGPPGDIASPGNGGKGAAPGVGGRVAVQEYTHFGPEWTLGWERAASGIPGNDGSNGDAAPPAQSGKTGQQHVEQVLNYEKFVFYNKYLLAQYLLTMHQADLAYLAGDFQDAFVLYKWLATVITVQPQAADKLAAEFAAVHDNAASMLSQMKFGLDFYGDPMNHVPLVSFNYYQQLMPVLLNLGAEIEVIYNRYTDCLQKQQEQFKEFDSLMNKAKIAMTHYQEEIDQENADLIEINKTIVQLTAEQELQIRIVQAASEAFKNAVERKANECSFENILKIITSIIGMALNAFDAFSSLKNITSVAQGISSDVKIFKELRTVTDDFKNIAKNWNEIKDLNTAEAPDTAKLIMEQDKFDKDMEPFMSMPEAQYYKNQVHDLIAIIKSRNAKLIAYTSTIAAVAKNNARLIQKKSELDRIQGDEASRTDPTLSPYRSFVQGLYQDYKLMCLKYLYQENQAYNYWSLQANTFMSADNSFAELNDFHGKILAKTIDHMNTVFSPQQPLEVQLLITSVNDADRNKQFQQFKSTGRMVFQIPIDDDGFLGWSNVMATAFKIYLPGAKTTDPNNRLYIQLWHQGRVLIIDQNGGKHDFSHERVLSAYQYEMHMDPSGQMKPIAKGGGSLGGDARIALSPYAAWVLDVNNYNHGLDLTEVDRIELTLIGHALPYLGKSTDDQ